MARRLLGALTMSLGLAVLMVPLGYVKAGLRGDPPPTFTLEEMLLIAAVMFVTLFALWPSSLPSPFDKARLPWERPPADGRDDPL